MPERYYVTDNGFIDPGEYVDIDGVLPVPGFNFATFDPRVDGLAGDAGSVARAADCPITFVKVGPADTDWIVDGRGQRPALLAVLTAAEMNAMCRGFARQPALDFTPLHIWTPDAANDRFTDSVGADHLVKTGVGATIEAGPYYDERSAFGQQAEQTNLQTSYYAAADPSVCDVAEDPYVCMFVAGFAANAGGGLYISKIKYPAPGEDRGWGVSVNLDNGFGFLIRGDVAELNYDTATFGANVVDGRTRVFFHGRTIAGAPLGYTLTAGVPEVTAAGLAGDISNTDGIFGLVNDGFGLPISALSTSRTSKIGWWQGAAADNVTTYRAAIAAGFQDMFGESPHELQIVSQKYDRPVTNAQFAGRTGMTCAWYRPDWINAAGNVLSQGSAATLVATGATTQYQKLVSADVGMGFPAATLDACSANVIPVGLGSFLAGGTFGHVANAGGLNAHLLMGRIVGGATAHGWAVWVQDDGDLVYYVSDGILSFSAVVAAAILPLNARPLDIQAQLDRTPADPTFRILWARDGIGLGSAEVVMAGLGNLDTAGQEFGSGAIPAAAPAFNGGGSVHFLYCATGAQAGTSAQFTRVARAVGFLAVDVAAAQAVIG